MERSEAASKIAALRTAMGSLKALADKLDCTKGHAHALCNGNKGVSRAIAERLEAITGTPWHEWIAPAPEKKTDEARAA